MGTAYLCKPLLEYEDRCLVDRIGDTSYDEQSMRLPKWDGDTCLKTNSWLILPCEGVIH